MNYCSIVKGLSGSNWTIHAGFERVLRENTYLIIPAKAMIISTRYSAPSPADLINILRGTLNHRFSFRPLNEEQKVVVNYGWIPAAQIIIHENQLRLEEPSRSGIFRGNLFLFLLFTPLPLKPYRQKVQQHLASLLQRKYGES